MTPSCCSLSLFQVLFGLSSTLKTLSFLEHIYQCCSNLFCANFNATHVNDKTTQRVLKKTEPFLKVQELYRRASLTGSQQFMGQRPK